MKILIVEDERELAQSISAYLANEQALCSIAPDFNSALTFVEEQDFDCIILDIGLPGGSGLQLLARLKEDGKAEGVIIISAKNGLEDKVQGLRMGADDYLSKPFHLSELSARVEAIIRRKSFDGATFLHFDALNINLQEGLVKVHDLDLDLTKKEYDLLLYFISNKGRVVSKSALVSHLWGNFANGMENFDFIYTHIKNLRRKLSLAGSPDYIQSIYGIGYKFRLP